MLKTAYWYLNIWPFVLAICYTGILNVLISALLRKQQIAFSALTLLIWQQEELLACKN